MRLTFEPNLNYQQEAIRAVAYLFEGQTYGESDYQYYLNEIGALDLIGGVGNRLVLDEMQMLVNLQKYRSGMILPFPNL